VVWFGVVAGHELPTITRICELHQAIMRTKAIACSRTEAIMVEVCQAGKVPEATSNGQTTIAAFLSHCKSMFDLTDKDDKRHHQHAMKRPEPWDIDHIAVLAHHATLLLQGL
jgi:hypothetical protein